VLRLVPAFLCLALAGCGTVRTARVLTLGEVPPAESVRRAGPDAPAPVLVDEEHAFYRTIEIALSVEPALESYLARVLQTEIGVKAESLRVVSLGYRYAYYFPSRRDDLVLVVELVAKDGRISDTFEARIRGNESFHSIGLLGPRWQEDIPDTSPPGEAETDELQARIESYADGYAYKHRLLLRELARRLAREVLAGS
jgi:hypothetical protein